MMIIIDDDHRIMIIDPYLSCHYHHHDHCILSYHMTIEWGNTCDLTPSLPITREVAELDAELAKAQAVMNTLKAGSVRPQHPMGSSSGTKLSFPGKGTNADDH